MADEATGDAHHESEQATGWFTMFEERLPLPFETKVIGTAVTVASIDLRDSCQIVAVCTRRLKRVGFKGWIRGRPAASHSRPPIF